MSDYTTRPIWICAYLASFIFAAEPDTTECPMVGYKAHRHSPQLDRPCGWTLLVTPQGDTKQ